MGSAAAVLSSKQALIQFANDAQAIQQARSAALATFPDFPSTGQNYLVWAILRWSGWGGAYHDNAGGLYASLLVSGVRRRNAQCFSPEAGDLYWISDTGMLGIVAKGCAEIGGKFRGVDWQCVDSSRYVIAASEGVDSFLRLPG